MHRAWLVVSGIMLLLLAAACGSEDRVIWECDCLTLVTFCSDEHPAITDLSTGDTVKSGCCSATETPCTCQDAEAEEGCLCGADADPCSPPEGWTGTE